jgi:hypothetical protein
VVPQRRARSTDADAVGHAVLTCIQVG